MNRLDNLRRLASRAAEDRMEFHRFLPAFADRLVAELACFLGSPDCVALCCASGEFSFEHGAYGYDGLRFKTGRYQVPLMFRLHSVAENTDLLIRLRLYFTNLDADQLGCQIEDGSRFDFRRDDLSEVTEKIYQYLCDCCKDPAWFKQHLGNYRSVSSTPFSK